MNNHGDKNLRWFQYHHKFMALLLQLFIIRYNVEVLRIPNEKVLPIQYLYKFFVRKYYSMVTVFANIF